jgi:hypothetical protein
MDDGKEDEYQDKNSSLSSDYTYFDIWLLFYHKNNYEDDWFCYWVG